MGLFSLQAAVAKMCLSTSRLLSGLGCVRSTRDKPSSTRLRANAADSPQLILGSSSGLSALSGGHCRSLSTAAAIRRASIPAKEEPIAHGPALPLRAPLRIALVAIAVGICAGAVVRLIFDPAVLKFIAGGDHRFGSRSKPQSASGQTRGRRGLGARLTQPLEFHLRHKSHGLMS